MRGAIRGFESVERHRRALIHDPMSDTFTLSDWASATSATIEGCLFSPGTSAEYPNVDLEQLHGLATLYLPYGADVEDSDRVTARGRLWKVSSFRGDWSGTLIEGSVVSLEYIRNEEHSG